MESPARREIDRLLEAEAEARRLVEIARDEARRLEEEARVRARERLEQARAGLSELRTRAAESCLAPAEHEVSWRLSEARRQAESVARDAARRADAAVDRVLSVLLKELE